MNNIISSDIVGNMTLDQQKLNIIQISVDSTVAVLNSIIDDLNEKMPLSGTDGTASFGSLSVGNAISSCSIMNVDQKDKDVVFNFCSRGGVVEASMGKYAVDSGTAVGACVGALGYCCLSVWTDETTEKTHMKLSGDVSKLKDIAGNTDAEWTFSFLNHNYVQLKVDPDSVEQELTAATVTLAEKLTLQDKAPTTEEGYIALWTTAAENEDDNVLYCARYPDAGNQVVPYFYGTHIEGCKTRAIQRCTHAEGRRTLADGRYSHAEGSDCKAIGTFSHAEGSGNIVYCEYSHAEGLNNVISGFAVAAHVEGSNNTATARSTHVEGEYNVVNGCAAHVGGKCCTADGDTSFAHGRYCYADGCYSIALGNNTTAAGNKSFVWSGSSVDNADKTTSYMYGKKIDGCFAVNPKDGADGFYIGEKTLKQIIDEAVAAALAGK